MTISIHTEYRDWTANAQDIRSASEINREGGYVRWNASAKRWSGNADQWASFASALEAEAKVGEGWAEGKRPSINVQRTLKACVSLRRIESKARAATSGQAPAPRRHNCYCIECGGPTCTGGLRCEDCI